MNWNSFSLLGYLSVLLWFGVPLLWLLRRRSHWVCPAALALALGSLLFAKINSETHVNRIEPDRSAQMESARALEEKKLKVAEQGRGDQVADVRFAEDGSGDFLDKAGMNQGDLKYLESLDGASEPEWKKKKKTRSGANDGDGSLDAALGGDEAINGVKTEALEKKQEKPPILMSDADLAMAHRLDGLNLTVIRVLVLLALLMIIVDYLRRANVYAQAITPLPLPSSWLNSITAIPPVVERSTPARRAMPAELAWLAKRGDCFVYLTDDAAAAAAVPPTLPRLGKAWCPVDVLRVDGGRISDEFVFEALWYGRSCFVVDSPERAGRMLARFLELLEERKKVRASVSQTVHVVWDLKRPLAERELESFSRLAKANGFSLFASRDMLPSPESA